jgi:hypothetical protein
MKLPHLLLLALLWTFPAEAALPQRSSLLAPEPGTIDIEGQLPQTIHLTLKDEAGVYATSTLQRPVGSMAPGTQVTLVGLSDQTYRVRGRARHGDVAGWIKADAFVMKDPELPAKLKALFERQKQITELIAAKQVALGMTPQEVLAALGKPSRKSSRVTAAGRQDLLEYSVYDRIPQYRTGIDPFGNPIQTVVYLKVEVGTLSVSFKDGLVDAIDEVKGNPLQGGQVRIVPGPVFFR